MTDRQLLELAARAAGIDAEWCNQEDADYDAQNEGLWLKGERTPDNSPYWNPIRRDADAFRLAVRLGLDICIGTPFDIGGAETQVIGFVSDVGAETIDVSEFHGLDPCAATRRAIVRAAAAMANIAVTNKD